MEKNNRGSMVVWLILLIVLVVISVAFGLIWTKVIMVSTGIDQNQVNTYKNAIDKANDVKQKIELQQKENNF